MSVAVAFEGELAVVAADVGATFGSGAVLNDGAAAPIVDNNREDPQ